MGTPEKNRAAKESAKGLQDIGGIEYEYFVDQFDSRTLQGILNVFAKFSPEAERTVLLLKRPKGPKPYTSEELPAILTGWSTGD